MPDAIIRLKPTYGAPALVKGLDILECLSAAKTPLSLAAISSELGRSSAEIFRMIYVLEERGYIASDPAHTGYNLTTKAFTLGTRSGAYADFIKTTNQLLQDFANKTAQTCSLGVILASSAVIISAAVPPEPYAINVRVGSQSELIKSAIGTMLYALLPERDKQAMALYLQPRYESAVWSGFLESTEKARKIGYAEIVDANLPLVTHVAVPLRAGHRILGALNMPYVRHCRGPTQAHLRQALIKASASFSDKL